MKSEMQTLSTTIPEYSDGPNWRQIQEDQAWEDFLAFCRQQENGPHE